MPASFEIRSKEFTRPGSFEVYLFLAKMIYVQIHSDIFYHFHSAL